MSTVPQSATTMTVAAFSIASVNEAYTTLIQGHSEPDWLALNARTLEKFSARWMESAGLSERPVRMRFRNATVITDDNLPDGALHFWQEKKHGVHNEIRLTISEWES